MISAALLFFSLFIPALTSFTWTGGIGLHFSFTHSNYCDHIKINHLLVFTVKSIIFHWCCQSLKICGVTLSYFIFGLACFTIHNKNLQLRIGVLTLSIDEPEESFGGIIRGHDILHSSISLYGCLQSLHFSKCHSCF